MATNQTGARKPKGLLIIVTQEHIDRALSAPQGYDGGSCPIALAVRDKLKISNMWVTSDATLQIGHDFYEPSKAAERFVRNLDNKVPVQPATFRYRGLN